MAGLVLYPQEAHITARIALTEAMAYAGVYEILYSLEQKVYTANLT